MEEAQEILLNSLENWGVSLPVGITSVKNLTPTALVSICSQSLHLIDESSSFSTLLPDSMAEQFKICTEISAAIKSLGYRGDLSFHQFLYPSEEDSHKLVRFLVEKISETSQGRNAANRKEIKARLRGEEDKYKDSLKDRIEEADHSGVNRNNETVMSRLKELKLEPVSSDPLTDDTFLHGSLEAELISEQGNEPAVALIPETRSLKSMEKEELSEVEDLKIPMKEFEHSWTDAIVTEEHTAQRHGTLVAEFGQNISRKEQLSKLRTEIEDLRNQENMLVEQLTDQASEYHHLENELELLKAVEEMAFDEKHPVDFYVEELNKQVEAGRQKLVELEVQWDAFRKPLEERKRSVEDSLCAEKPEMLEKLQKVKEFELETEAVIFEIQKRKEDHSRLSAELENQTKIASRKSYIQRITEITKNSRKQDADVERILQETRELQLESNSIQERLHRSYAVLEEMVFRDAKKDPVRRQAYRLLTSIHESFQQISEKILSIDRTRREAAEQDAKLTTMSSRSLDINKLQADLEAIRRENEFLEQKLQHN
ncbi:coiled-coil domain-containing protein 22 isoform X1 [Telopea speciosissima]|uniref:coiled-coil domain-containing protein 22 isoform X1 n=1 Tax=Telopea speciosissima TaxID=54955 RepID=UPI001CC5D8D1|nr:coiled-coil domain-containing protein 22 isoform X1 [Telopea speciosissima]